MHTYKCFISKVIFYVLSKRFCDITEFFYGWELLYIETDDFIFCKHAYSNKNQEDAVEQDSYISKIIVSKEIEQENNKGKQKVDFCVISYNFIFMIFSIVEESEKRYV
jgi:hypothetical protein